MTEVVVQSADQQTSNVATCQQAQGGAGQLLRAAREQQQLSLQAVASTLKVPVYKLQALEEDHWDVLTDSVFTRSLALSVCRLLQIPPEPVLAGLPKHEAAKLASNPEGINAPFKEKSLRSLMSPSQDSGASNAIKVAAALLIAVAGGVGLYVVPQWQTGHAGDVDAVTAEEGTAQEPLFMPNPLAEREAPATEQPAAAKVDAGSAAAEAAVAVKTPTSAAEDKGSVADAAAVAAAPVVPAAAPVAEPVAAKPAAAASNRHVLRFVASAESWVQVRDAQQQVVMEKILKAGDVFEEAPAGRPLQVVVGNAGATKLEIDGAAFDLAAVAKNNVARFEVK